MPRLTVARRSVEPSALVAIVLGDLMVDVVLEPERLPEAGTDVPGRVEVRAGGSAANTARWLARLGARTTLIGSVGRDSAGRALVAVVRRDGVTPHVVRVAGHRTGRIGVLVSPGGERSFVADRGAADWLRPEDLPAAWFARADVLHLPAYSLLGEPLGGAGRRAAGLAGDAGAIVSLDLASSGPLLAAGCQAALALIRAAAPDLLFGTADEVAALLGITTRQPAPDRTLSHLAVPADPAVELDPAAEADRAIEFDPAVLLDLAPLVVLKRGARGATVITRGPKGDRSDGVPLDVPAAPVVAADSTGAGDAFDAGFLVAWLAGVGLRQSVLAGHRAARWQLTARPRRRSLPALPLA